MLTPAHSLWGNPSHLNFLSTSLREKYPEDRLHILVAKRNAGSFTYDGIDTGGERVAHEIEETLAELARNGHEIKKMSIIGYSLGGLISRDAIGLLFHKGVFQKIKPMVRSHYRSRGSILILFTELYNIRHSTSGRSNTPPWCVQFHMERAWRSSRFPERKSAVHHRHLPKHGPTSSCCACRP